MLTEFKIDIRPPVDCSQRELEEFATFVEEGGEVNPYKLRERIGKAYALLFFRENARLIGVAALKQPDHSYRASIFKKAHSTLSPELYPFELGWIFILHDARGRKLSHHIVGAAVEYSGNVGLFATARADNFGMHNPLAAKDFVKNGVDFRSSRGKYNLSLFIRNAAQKH